MKTLLVVVAALAYSLAILIMGAIGIQHSLGYWWSVAAIGLSFVFRITLPLAVGAFYCAWKLWEWPVVLAALFALPGLLFMVPAIAAAIVDALAGIWRRKRG